MWISSSAAVQVGVGAGQGVFGALHQDAAHRLLQQAEQDVPLVGHPVFRGIDQGGVALLGKDALGVVEDGGEDVVVQKGRDHGDLPGGRVPGQAGGVGAAALAALDQALVGQELEGMADGLPAHVIAADKLRLGGQLEPAAPSVLYKLLPQQVGQKFVFHCHRSISIHWAI